MWLFSKKRELDNSQDAKIKELRDETFRKIENATKKTQKVNDLLERGGTTYLIFLATGGEKRGKK